MFSPVFATHRYRRIHWISILCRSNSKRRLFIQIASRWFCADTQDDTFEIKLIIFKMWLAEGVPPSLLLTQSPEALACG